jgi:hypothetical protein
MVKYIQDDRSGGKIEYVGNWEPINNGTRTLRRVVEWGASATFRFNGAFHLLEALDHELSRCRPGNFIAVYGAVPSATGSTEEQIRLDFRIDDRALQPGLWKMKPGVTVEHQMFYHVGALDEGQQHVLYMQYLGDGRGQGGREFLFDYIEWDELGERSPSPPTPSTPPPASSVSDSPTLPSSSSTRVEPSGVSPPAPLTSGDSNVTPASSPSDPAGQESSRSTLPVAGILTSASAQGHASPSILTLSGTTITLSSPSTSSEADEANESPENVGVSRATLLGAVLGALGGTLLLVALFLFCRRRIRKKGKASRMSNVEAQDPGHNGKSSSIFDSNLVQRLIDFHFNRAPEPYYSL